MGNRKMDWNQFREMCESKGTTSIIKIKKAWDIYKITYQGMNDGKSKAEVGLNIKPIDDE